MAQSYVRLVWRERVIAAVTRTHPNLGRGTGTGTALTALVNSSRRDPSRSSPFRTRLRGPTPQSISSDKYFSENDELCLAAREIRFAPMTDRLSALIKQEDDAVERLHAFVVECYRLCRRWLTVVRSPAPGHYSWNLLGNFSYNSPE